MTIQLNGEAREVPEGMSLAALLEWLKLPGDRVAVERNLEIVPRASWAETPIQAGDRLEVVHLVGGGSGRSKSDRSLGASGVSGEKLVSWPAPEETPSLSAQQATER